MTQVLRPPATVTTPPWEPAVGRHRSHVGPPARLVADALDVERLLHRIADPEPGRERLERVLEQHLDLGPQHRELSAAGGEQVVAVETHGAGVGVEQAHQQHAKGGLAGAGGAHQPDDLAPNTIARREIGAHARDEEVVAAMEPDMCGVDAIQFLTGCTFGKGNLIDLDVGKNACSPRHAGGRQPQVYRPL